MTTTPRFPRLHLTAVTVLLTLSLLIAGNPAAQAYAQAMATPVAPEVETPIAQPEEIDIPTPAVEVTPISTEAPAEVQQPTAPEVTPGEIAPELIRETEVVEETPTVAATPAPQMVAPMAVTPGGNMSRCEQSSETISPGEQITAACTFTLWVISYSTVTGRIVRPSLPTGYTASISTSTGAYLDFSDPGHLDFTFPRASLFGQTQVRINITIAADEVNVPTESFDRTFNTCMLVIEILGDRCSIVAGQHSSIRVTADFDSRQLIEDSHYSFRCDQVEPASVGLDAPASSECEVVPGVNLGANRMQLDHIDWILEGQDGWEVTVSGQKLTGSSGQFKPEPAPIISSTASHSFAVTFTPIGCPAASSQPNLVLKAHLTPAGQTTGSSTSAGVPLTAAFDAPKQDTSARLTAIPGTVQADYSMTTPQDLSAGFTAEYTVSGCKTWTGYAEMTEFTPASDTDALSVPVLESVTPGAPRIISGGMKNMTPAEQNTITTAPTTLITGDAPGQKVVVEQDINLKYRVPANTTVGTYESTVTVNITSAP